MGKLYLDALSSFGWCASFSLLLAVILILFTITTTIILPDHHVYAHLTGGKVQEWIDKENSLKIQFAYEPERPVIDANTTLKFSVQDLTGNHIKEFLATVTVTDGQRIFRFNNITVADGDFSVNYLFPDYGAYKVLVRINTLNSITVGSFDVLVPTQAQPGLVNSPPTSTSGTADNAMIVLIVAAVLAGVAGSVAVSLIIKRKRRRKIV